MGWLAAALSLLSVLSMATLAFGQGSEPIVQCTAPPGTRFAAVQVINKTGDTNTVTLTLTGDTTDFTLEAPTGTLGNVVTGTSANVVVGTAGISAANCQTTQSVTVTATQP